MPLTDREVEQAQATARLAILPAERTEAQGQVLEHFRDDGLARRFGEVLPQGVAQGQAWSQAFERALRLNRGTVGQRPDAPRRPGGRETVDFDPFGRPAEVPGLRPRGTKFPGAVLREMGRQNPIASSCIAHYRNKTLAFADPVNRNHRAILNQEEGFDIVLRDRPLHQELSDDDKRERRAIIDFVLLSGDAPRFHEDPRATSAFLRRDPYDAYLARLVNDRFVEDAIAIELQRSRNGRRLRGYYRVDPDSVWHVTPEGDPGWQPGQIRNPRAVFAQAYNRQIVTELDANQLYYARSNPRLELGAGDYGMSEVESTFKLAVGMLNILTMTNAHFDRAALPEGFLVLSGYFNEEALTYLRDEYAAYRMDPGGGFGLPILSFRDPQAKASFLETSRGPKDLEHSLYANLLIALTCAQFGTDVQDINASPVGGNNAGLSSGKNHKEREEGSRGRGFRPWMKKVARIQNDILAPVLGEKWVFVLHGLERYDPAWLAEVYTATHTLDEIRSSFFDSPALGGYVGGVPAQNPAVSQLALAAAKDGARLGGKLEKDVGTPAPARGERKQAIAKALLALLDEDD